MTKERLSKLQLLILRDILEKRYIFKDYLKRYYGKQLKDNWSNTERVTIHKSLHNLESKNLIFTALNDRYYLTEIGFELLKANPKINKQINVNFKEYKRLIDSEIDFFSKQPSLTEKVAFLDKIEEQWEKFESSAVYPKQLQ